MPNDAEVPAGWVAGPARSVVAEVVADCLADIDSIAAQFLLEVQKIDGYAGSTVVDQDLQETAVASLELLLRLVGELPIPDRLSGISRALGHRRAQQGVPLESLLRAVRMDFRILWTAMLERVPAASLPHFTADAVRVWEAVEFHTIRVHAGYLDELASMAHEKETQRAFLLSRLVNSDGKDPQLLSQAARALGVNPDNPFIVAVSAEHGQKAFRAGVQRAGAGQYMHERDGALILILERAGSRGQTPAETPSWLYPLDCFVAPPAPTLADVPRMLRVALESLPTVTPENPGARTISDAWRFVAAHRMGEYGTVLASSVLGPLDSISFHERGRLIETASEYFRSGSVSDTAKHLYCHRNTVLNRLGRLAELTGYDPANPQDAATIITALQVRALGETSNDVQ